MNSLCLFFVLGLFCWVLSLVAEGLDSGIRGCKSELTIISWLAKVTLEIRDVWLCILAHSVLGMLLFCFDFGLVVLRVLTQGLGDDKSELTIIISWLVKVPLEMYVICTCLIESLCFLLLLAIELLRSSSTRVFILVS